MLARWFFVLIGNFGSWCFFVDGSCKEGLELVEFIRSHCVQQFSGTARGQLLRFNIKLTLTNEI